MNMTPTCVLLGFLSVLLLVTKSTASSQAEIRKRIFCNFYGCGQKRSGGTVINDMLADNGKDSENLIDQSDFSSNIPIDNMADFNSPLTGFESLTGPEKNLMSSLEGEKYLRAAALWESLKRKLASPSHGIKRRSAIDNN